MRVPKWSAAVVTVVLFSVACGGKGGGRGSSATSSGLQATVPEGAPRPEAPAATLAFLGDEGAPLLIVHEAAVSLAASGTEAASCRATAARLDTEAGTETVVALTAGVADRVLRAALHAERTALGVALSTCISKGSVDAASVAPAAGTVTARLGQLRAAL
jgi:hypothetical protein